MTELELLRQQNEEWGRRLGEMAAVRDMLVELMRICQSLEAASDVEGALYYALQRAEELLEKTAKKEAK